MIVLKSDSPMASFFFFISFTQHSIASIGCFFNHADSFAILLAMVYNPFMEKHVFISYTKKDNLVAEKIATALKTLHIPCWFAPAAIEPGDEWSKNMMEAVKQSSLVVLVFSAATNDATYVKAEITSALNNRIQIILFRIENIEPQGVFEIVSLPIQRLDAFTPPLDDHINKLVAAVRKHVGNNPLPSPPVPSSSSGNPFTDIGAIKIPERFIGRQAEIVRLHQYLQNGSVSIQGEPKIGKSSLLLSLARTWPGEVAGPINCQTYMDTDDFFQAIAIALKLDKPDRKSIRDSLQKRRVLLLLDELDYAPKRGITNDDMVLFRALSDSNRNFKMVAVSRRPLKEIFPDTGKGSPFYNILLPLSLGPLTEPEAQQVLVHPWLPGAPLFAADTCTALIQLTGCHPYKLQRAAYHCFESILNPTYEWETFFKKDIEDTI